MLSLVYDLSLVTLGFFAGDYIRKNFPGVYQDLLNSGAKLYQKVIGFFKK